MNCVIKQQINFILQNSNLTFKLLTFLFCIKTADFPKMLFRLGSRLIYEIFDLLVLLVPSKYKDGKNQFFFFQINQYYR